MSCYVYIIQSEVDGSFYKGITENPVQRLSQHNQGLTFNTRGLVPWRLVYVEEMKSRGEAMKRERNLKKATRERIMALLSHQKNIVHQLPER